MTEEYKIFKESYNKRWGKVVWEVSNLGNVKKNGEKYQCSDNHHGYLKFSNYLLHRVVAKLFIENPENKKEVDHIDTDKTNCRVDNLRWVTKTENQRNPLSLKRQKEAHEGEKHYRAKAVAKCSLDGEILEVRPYLRAFEKDGFVSSNITACCQGKRKSHKGFLWKYID